jgi:hypothetical protein
LDRSGSRPPAYATRSAHPAFIRAYANVERLDHDHVEIKLFEAWLKGCDALGIKPDPSAKYRI